MVLPVLMIYTNDVTQVNTHEHTAERHNHTLRNTVEHCFTLRGCGTSRTFPVVLFNCWLTHNGKSFTVVYAYAVRKALYNAYCIHIRYVYAVTICVHRTYIKRIYFCRSVTPPRGNAYNYVKDKLSFPCVYSFSQQDEVITTYGINNTRSAFLLM